MDEGCNIFGWNALVQLPNEIHGPPDQEIPRAAVGGGNPTDYRACRTKSDPAELRRNATKDSA
jgi:hypothetical protein